MFLQKVLGVNVCLGKSWLMYKVPCVETGVRRPSEVEEQGGKLADVKGMVVRGMRKRP